MLFLMIKLKLIMGVQFHCYNGLKVIKSEHKENRVTQENVFPYCYANPLGKVENDNI
jgi:hypothetical protein